MSNNSLSHGFLAILGQLPVFATAAVGVALMLVQQRRLGNAGLLAAAAFAILALLSIFQPLFFSFIPAMFPGRPGAQIASIIGSASLIFAILHAGALVLLILAMLPARMESQASRRAVVGERIVRAQAVPNAQRPFASIQ